MQKPQLKQHFTLRHFTYKLKDCYLKVDESSNDHLEGFETYFLSPEGPSTAPEKLTASRIAIRIHPKLIEDLPVNDFLNMKMNIIFESNAGVDVDKENTLKYKTKLKSSGFFKPNIYNDSKTITFYNVSAEKPSTIPGKVVEFRLPDPYSSEPAPLSRFGGLISEILMKVGLKSPDTEQIKTEVIWIDDDPIDEK